MKVIGEALVLSSEVTHLVEIEYASGDIKLVPVSIHPERDLRRELRALLRGDGTQIGYEFRYSHVDLRAVNRSGGHDPRLGLSVSGETFIRAWLACSSDSEADQCERTSYMRSCRAMKGGADA